MEQRLTIITLGVSDLNVATDFYENKLGWKRHGNSMGDIVFFQLNGMQLAIFPRTELAKDAKVAEKGSGFKGFTLAHNVRSEKEVDDTIAALKSKGVKVVKEPQKAEWGGYSSYIEDPDGNLWEIAFNPYMKLDEKGSVIG
ncbi:MAG TPA: VOC family protein [Bacteroidia bacterium]|nr:VOC family protein [Bacteroidia bacterium]